MKALYRRGTSCLKSGETETALADFNKVTESDIEMLSEAYFCRSQVLEIEPQNKAAVNQVTICKRVVKESHEKEKKLYANMFTKFANVDKEVRLSIRSKLERNVFNLRKCGSDEEVPI